MTVLKIFALIVAGTAVMVMLRGRSSQYTLVVEIALAAVVAAVSLPLMRETFLAVGDILGPAFSGETSVSVILKSFVILCAGGICTDICRDNGSASAAALCEIVMKCYCVVLVFPLVAAAAETALNFIGGNG